MLTHKTQVESTKIRCKKGLSTLKAMAAKSIEQHHVFAVSECDTQRHWLWSGSHNPITVQPAEARQGTKRSYEVILGTTKGTPIEVMCCLLDLSSIETRHKVEQIKAYLNAMQNPKNPLHDAIKVDKGCRLASHGWAKQNSQSSMCATSQSSSK